ncbi:oxysterol-binding protein-related protein 4C isoform X1 [Rhododendron vialii]|uniref:oxysterol-binding protein-related protein 4C isoform X1 n=1 Tax=Rhododendron vialii TaxID=182163 RepID=UPI00265EBE2E|nr:oxysterol-binding protein-related protein 4C isoform X1 [Rhododendron vialii]
MPQLNCTTTTTPTSTLCGGKGVAQVKREEEEEAIVKEASRGGSSNNSNTTTSNRKRKAVVLTAPLKLEGEGGDEYRAPNILQRVLGLLKNVRPGTDLTRFQMPPIFNIPKTMLQVYGESVYCVGKDLLGQCANGRNPVDRFISVVAWNISTLRPLMFGVAPYNPILGETHHVSRGTLNVLCEQVSHHPPVSSVHATDDDNGIEMIWCHHIVPKFNGASVESVVNGQRELKLLNRGENYVVGTPNLLIRFLPMPGVYWSGNIRIHCQETGLEAELCFGGSSFLGRRANQRSVRGKIFMASSRKTIYEVNGHWDRAVTVKDVSNGKLTVIYDAPTVLSGLKTPILKDPEGLWPSESAVVWAEVSQNILSKCWEKAREAKTAVEERERDMLRERKAKGETWVPKHFTVSYSKEGGWTCLPNQRLVPPAPIVVPF